MNGTHIATTNSIWLDDKRDIYSIYSYRQEQKKEFYGRNYIKYPNRKKNGTEKLNMCAMYGIYYTFWCTSEHDIQERTWKWKYPVRDFPKNTRVFLFVRNNNNHCHFDSCLVIWMLDYAKVLTLFYSSTLLLDWEYFVRKRERDRHGGEVNKDKDRERERDRDRERKGARKPPEMARRIERNSYPLLSLEEGCWESERK